MWFAPATAALSKSRAPPKARRSRASRWTTCWSWRRRELRNWFSFSARPWPLRTEAGQHRHQMPHLKHGITFKRSITLRSALTFLFLFAVLGLAALGNPAAAQSHSYTSPKVQYIVEFP